MPITFGPTLMPRDLKDIPAGTAFVLEQGGVGQLLCLKGQDDKNDFVIILATRGVQGNEAQPHFFDAAYSMGQTVLPVDDLQFDFAGGHFGLPVPGERQNGAIAITENGEHWFCVGGFNHQLGYVNLTTGLFGNPEVKAHFPRWRILWHKPGAKDPIVVAERP